MTDDLKEAGVECVEELCSELLRAAARTMTRHGNDPNSRTIVVAGFVMAIEAIGKHNDPLMPIAVREMLAKSHA